MEISLARAHTTIVTIFVHGWSFKQLNSQLVTLFLRVCWSLQHDIWFTSFEHGQSSNLNRWSYKWAQINGTVHKKDPANFYGWVVVLTWFIYDKVNFGQSCPKRTEGANIYSLLVEVVPVLDLNVPLFAIVNQNHVVQQPHGIKKF